MSNEVEEFANTHTKEEAYLYNNRLWVGKLISGEEYSDNITFISRQSTIAKIEAENEAILKSW